MQEGGRLLEKPKIQCTIGVKHHIWAERKEKADFLNRKGAEINLKKEFPHPWKSWFQITTSTVMHRSIKTILRRVYISDFKID